MAKHKTPAGWRRIADDDVCHVWRLACDCPRTGGTQVGDEMMLVEEFLEVAPNSYGEDDSGVPVCENCGQNREYSHTLIREKKTRRSDSPCVDMSGIWRNNASTAKGKTK